MIDNPSTLPTLEDAERFFAEKHGFDPDFELPYPAVSVPEYQMGQYRRWEITRIDVPIIRGYFKGMQQNMNNNYALYRRKRGVPETWMSLTPMELESHMPHIAAAHGDVAVVGLGMGLYLHNVLPKEEVSSVTVFEIDRQVKELLYKRSNIEAWPNLRKLSSYVFRDMLKGPVTSREFGHLYVDIWSILGDENARANVVNIASRIPSESHSWWGMELDFIEWCTTQLKDNEKLTDEIVKNLARPWSTACADYRLNVLPVTDNEHWPSLALRAVHNVTLY